GVGRVGVADGPAGGGRLAARRAGGEGARARRALLAGAAGLPAGGGPVAGAGGGGGPGQGTARVPRLPARHPVPADRQALFAVLGPSPAGVVPPGRDRHHVDPAGAGAAVGAAGLVAAAAPARCALPAAAGLVGTAAGVLLHSRRQA